MSQLPRPKILLVEDSEDDAFFFSLALGKTGWPGEQVHVMDGGQAVEYLEESSRTGTVPELIFLDLKLPGLNGFEVLKWIGLQNFQPPLRVIVLSGSDHQGDIRLARELGAAEYLVKPVKADDLKNHLPALPRGTSVPWPAQAPGLKAALP